MTCEDCERLLSEALDEQTSPPPDVLKHIHACDRCRQFKANAERLGRQLRSDAEAAIAQEELPADFARQVVARARLNREEDLSFPYLLFAAAAGLVVVLGILTFFLFDRTAPPDRGLRQLPPRPPAPEIVERTVQPLPDIPQQFSKLDRAVQGTADNAYRAELNRIGTDLRRAGNNALFFVDW